MNRLNDVSHRVGVLLPITSEAVGEPFTRHNEALNQKPVLVDLESYFGLDVFRAWLEQYGSVEATEMLPNPDELWWREDGQRYCHEFRAMCLPSRRGRLDRRP
jgi:hypothetical protein